jgi:hypothetical protein
MRDYTQITNYSGSNNNIVEVLCEQYKNWLSVFFARELMNLDFNVISYEEIINNYTNSITKIENFLEEKFDIINTKDVRLKSLQDKQNNIIYTDNDFRRGCIGDWIDTFGEKWGNEIKEIYDNEITYHLEAYINNPKLHEFHDPEQKYFQINSRDWKLIERNIDLELIPFQNKFKTFSNEFDIQALINDRYDICERKINDIRYKHKVFFYKNYVLKFLYPCKALLNKKTFNYVIPIASKINLLTILKTNDILYKLNIIPKLYYAGIYNGILFVIQERFEDNKLVNAKYNVKTKCNWDWIIDNNLFPLIFEQFTKAIKHNILLTDHISPFNLVLCDNKLKYLDLDGIHIFNTQKELFDSKKYWYNVDDIINKLPEVLSSLI